MSTCRERKALTVRCPGLSWVRSVEYSSVAKVYGLYVLIDVRKCEQKKKLCHDDVGADNGL